MSCKVSTNGTGQLTGAVLLVQCNKSGFILDTALGNASCSHNG